jgi:hypothetical protein
LAALEAGFDIRPLVAQQSQKRLCRLVAGSQQQQLKQLISLDKCDLISIFRDENRLPAESLSAYCLVGGVAEANFPNMRCCMPSGFKPRAK